VDYKGGSAPNVFQGQLVSGNSVLFAGIPVDPPGNGQRILRLMNLRGNASSLSSATAAQPAVATATIQSSGFNQSLGPVTVGFTQRGLGAFNILNASGGAPSPPPLNVPVGQINQSPNGARLDGQAHFREAAAGFFRAASVEAGDFSSTAPPLPGIGVASQGTQFEVAFTGIPPNALLFVTMVDVSGGTKAKLVAVDANGTPPTQGGTTSNGVPLALLRPTATGAAPTAIGIWEWVAPGQSVAIQDVAFGFALIGSAPAGAVISVLVKGSLFPISTAIVSTAGAPVPRFTDDSVTLNPGFTIA
jgi:hypothetical protein